MKKILFVLFLLSMGFCSYAQEIIGKWRGKEETSAGLKTWVEIEYKRDNTFSLKAILRSLGDNFDDFGVYYDNILEMNGHFECSGKAFSHTFDENSFQVYADVSFYPDCRLSEEHRKEITRKLKDETKNNSSSLLSQARLYTSGGMYKQILLLNYERMILGRPGGEAEEFTRIVSEEELSAAKSKREAERARWKATRMKTIKETAEGETKVFVSDFKAKYPEARTTESGLVYYIQEMGLSGTNASSDDDVVHVNYRGYYLNGMVFDQANNIELRLNRVIPGWCEGVKMVGEGGQITVVVPYSLAYGENGNDIIPPFSTLVYDIEVLSVQHSGENKQAPKNLPLSTMTAKEDGVEQQLEDASNSKRLVANESVTGNTIPKTTEIERHASNKDDGEEVVAKMVDVERLADKESAPKNVQVEHFSPPRQDAYPEVTEVSPAEAVVKEVKVSQAKKTNAASGLVQSIGMSTAKYWEYVNVENWETGDCYGYEVAHRAFLLDYSIGYRLPSGLYFGVVFEGTQLDYADYEPSGFKLFACVEARYSAMTGRVRPFIAGGLGRHLINAKEFHNRTTIFDPCYGKGGISYSLGGKKSIDFSVGYGCFYIDTGIVFSAAFSF